MLSPARVTPRYLNRVIVMAFQLEEADNFLEPVNPNDYPDYHDEIKEPMDLSTMKRKVRTLGYGTIKEFVDDLDRIGNNCETYCHERFPQLIPVAKR